VEDITQLGISQGYFYYEVRYIDLMPGISVLFRNIPSILLYCDRNIYEIYVYMSGISHLSSAWPQMVLRKYITCADDPGPRDIRVGPSPGSHFMAPKNKSTLTTYRLEPCSTESVP